MFFLPEIYFFLTLFIYIYILYLYIHCINKTFIIFQEAIVYLHVFRFPRSCYLFIFSDLFRFPRSHFFSWHISISTNPFFIYFFWPISISTKSLFTFAFRPTNIWIDAQINYNNRGCVVYWVGWAFKDKSYEFKSYGARIKIVSSQMFGLIFR